MIAEAIKREKDAKKVRELSGEISNLTEQRNQLKAKWQSEKDAANKVQEAKTEIENYKLQAEQAERAGDYGKVAELRYGKIREAESRLKEAELQLKATSGSRMLKEEVDAEDIAQIVSKWTGIPVSKMMQSEKEKLLQIGRAHV